MRILFCLLLMVNQCWGATYYVRLDGPNGDGLSDATAWNLDKANTTGVAAGSTVLFRRGDVFTNALEPKSNLTYGAYGTGADPLFSGLHTVTSWTQQAGNIYYAPLGAGSELNVVLIDGKLRGMGRYPKTGYLHYSGHTQKDKLWGPDISALPFDPTGAEIVLRKIRQVTSRFLCTRSADTLRLTIDAGYQTNRANNNTHDISDGFGFFVQHSLATLTSDGDWYYDAAQMRLYVYFSGGPAGRSVRAASLRTVMQVAGLSHTSFKNLAFEGANFALFSSYDIDHISFQDCELRHAKTGLHCETNTRSVSIKRSRLRGLVNNGIFMAGNSPADVVDSVRIDSVSFAQIGTIAGMGGSGDAHQLASWVVGDHVWITHNGIDSIGYHGIVAHGNVTYVEYNRITRFGMTKDDVGGVYDFQHTGTSSVGQFIRYNYIADAIDSGEGTIDNHGEAYGVYIDADVTATEVAYNTILRISYAGIVYVDAQAGNSAHHNLIQGCGSGLQIYKSRVPLRSFSFHHNRIVGTMPGQVGVHVRLNTDDNLGQMGQFYANEYHCIDRAGAFKIQREFLGNSLSRLTIGAWQRIYGLDRTSESNPTQSISPGGKRYRDATGKFYIFNQP